MLHSSIVILDFLVVWFLADMCQSHDSGVLYLICSAVVLDCGVLNSCFEFGDPGCFDHVASFSGIQESMWS